VATLVGATIQGSIGFGMNLVTVPVLALVLPESLPVAVIVLGIPVSITMLRHEWSALDRTGPRLDHRWPPARHRARRLDRRHRRR
jgi:uncharacterized protein